jgi:carboxymethylenebutenolidase
LGNFFELTATDGHTLRAYVAGAASQPCSLVLCHDYNGLNASIRRRADCIAAMGFQVIAPDLLGRAEPELELRCTPADRARGKACAARIATEHTMLDVAAAMAALGQPGPAILGFGWGATIAWHAAATLPGLRAAVCFYGDGIANARQKTPLCPAQLHVGEFDDQVPSMHVEAVRHAQPQVAIELYAGAAHDFFCEEQESFNGIATDLARENMMVFLRRHMPVAPPVLSTVAEIIRPQRENLHRSFGIRASA